MLIIIAIIVIHQQYKGKMSDLKNLIVHLKSKGYGLSYFSSVGMIMRAVVKIGDRSVVLEGRNFYDLIEPIS